MTRQHTQRGHAASIILVVLVLGVVGLVGWQVAKRHNAKAVTVTSASTTKSTPSATSSNTDNASLGNDLQGIDSSMNQEGNDNTTASNGLNDQQNEVTVPTN